MTMTHVFLDTSALIKLYLTKVGSVWLQNYLAEKLSVISQLALFEATTVLRRRYADGEFSEDVALAYLARIISDTKKYKRVPLQQVAEVLACRSAVLGATKVLPDPLMSGCTSIAPRRTLLQN